MKVQKSKVMTDKVQKVVAKEGTSPDDLPQPCKPKRDRKRKLEEPNVTFVVEKVNADAPVKPAEKDDNKSAPQRYSIRLQTKKVVEPEPRPTPEDQPEPELKPRSQRTGWEKCGKLAVIQKKKQDEKNKKFVATFSASKIKLKLKNQLKLKQKIEKGVNYSQKQKKKPTVTIDPKTDYYSPDLKDADLNNSDITENADANRLMCDAVAVSTAISFVTTNINIDNDNYSTKVPKQKMEDSIPTSSNITEEQSQIGARSSEFHNDEYNGPTELHSLVEDDIINMEDSLDFEIIRPKDIDESLSVELANNLESSTNSSHDMVPIPRRRRKQKMRSNMFHCKLCAFSGKNIVSHYVNIHVDSTIPEACIEKSVFDSLVEQNTSTSSQLFEISYKEELGEKPWPCLYCTERYTDVREYFEHLTTHTGEFIYSCGICSARHPHRKMMINHLKSHKLEESTGEVAKNLIITLDEPTVESGGTELHAYMCHDCNYFQLLSDSMSKHLETENHSESEVIYIKFHGPEINPITEAKQCKYNTDVHVNRSGDGYNFSTLLHGYMPPGAANMEFRSHIALLLESEKLSLGNVDGYRAGVKDIGVYQEMLSPEKLKDLFKCMGKSCSFTTDNANEFYCHLNDHEMRIEDTEYSEQDWIACSYCSLQFKKTQDLCSHIVNQHSQSLFQCGHCFYRALYDKYVQHHQNQSHPDESPNVLFCLKTATTKYINNTDIGVPLYKCSSECCPERARRFIFRDEFLDHVQKCVPPGSPYCCHICAAKYADSRQLVCHYKDHGVFRLQCSHCIFGTEELDDMETHVLEIHPNLPGRIFDRSSKEVVRKEDSMEDSEEEGRVTNREGTSLYRCANVGCTFSSASPSKPHPQTINSKPSVNTSYKSLVPKSSAPTVNVMPLICPKCNKYRTKNINDLIIHLHKELNYRRYKCKLCDHKFITESSLKGHIVGDHQVSYNYSLCELLPTDQTVEDYVSKCIEDQRQQEPPPPINNVPETRNVQEDLKCKHCNKMFAAYSNYRIHILAKHVAANRFSCKYCPQAFWNAGLAKRHHFRSTHASLPFVVVRNDDLEAKLTPEFWLKEYGFPISKSVKYCAAKHREENHQVDNTLEKQDSAKTEKRGAKSGSPEIIDLTNSPPGIPGSASLRSESGSPSPKKQRLEKSKENVYMCLHCKKNCFTGKGMRLHWLKYHSTHPKGLECSYYEFKGFTNTIQMLPGINLVCPYCSHIENSIAGMRIHNALRHPAKHFRMKRRELTDTSILQCSSCDYQGKTFGHIKKHSQLKHPGELPLFTKLDLTLTTVERICIPVGKLIEDKVMYGCSNCASDHPSTYSFQKHILNRPNHEECVLTVKYNRCVIQENVEIPHDDEQVQILIGDEAYKCPLCSYDTKDRNILIQNHLATHIKAFICPLCDRGFEIRLDSLLHIRLNHNEARVHPVSNKSAYMSYVALKEEIIIVNVNQEESDPLDLPSVSL